MTIRVIHPGQWSSVQDLGRPGHASIGVTPCGAADPLSLRIGNRLVGNPDACAAIEMTLVGATIAFDLDHVVAVTGMPASVTLHAPGGGIVEVRTHAAVTVRAGESLRVGAVRQGARAYLCVQGGIDVPRVLGSRSAHVPSGLGGTRLAPGDVLPVGQHPALSTSRTSLEANAIAELNAMLRPEALLVTHASHTDAFSPDSLNALASHEFRVSPRWDRVGLRLAGSLIPSPGGGQITTEAAWFGCVQVPPDGAPIVLGPDAPPTGGYPVALCVASAALPALGQRRAGDTLRFKVVSIEQARAEYVEQHARMNQILPAITEVPTR